MLRSMLLFTIVFLWICSSATKVSEFLRPFERTCSFQPSEVTLRSRGRLGNHIWGFMKGLALHKNFGLDVRYHEETIRMLRAYFPKASMPEVSPDFYKFYDAFNSLLAARILKYYREVSGNSSLKLDYDASRLAFILPDSIARVKHLDPRSVIDSDEFEIELLSMMGAHNKWEIFSRNVRELALPEWKENKRLFLHPGKFNGIEANLYMKPGFTESLAEHLVLKDDLLKYADEKLNLIRKKLGRKVIFVGAHSRRTDHLSYEMKNGLKPLSPTYYRKAMKLFRQKYENKKSRKVVAFIYVSDDMEWGKRMLGRSETNIFFLGTGNSFSERDIGKDLALLARCNHTIQSYGSFSYFAGFLAGGVKIIPEHFDEYRTPDIASLSSLNKDPFKHPIPRLYFFNKMN